jgi:hypothetical protein
VAHLPLRWALVDVDGVAEQPRRPPRAHVALPHDGLVRRHVPAAARAHELGVLLLVHKLQAAQRCKEVKSAMRSRGPTTVRRRRCAMHVMHADCAWAHAVYECTHGTLSAEMQLYLQEWTAHAAFLSACAPNGKQQRSRHPQKGLDDLDHEGHLLVTPACAETAKPSGADDNQQREQEASTSLRPDSAGARAATRGCARFQICSQGVDEICAQPNVACAGGFAPAAAHAAEIAGCRYRCGMPALAQQRRINSCLYIRCYRSPCGGPLLSR